MIFSEQLQFFDPQTPGDNLDNEFIFYGIPSGDVIVSAVVTSVPTDLVITDLVFTTVPNAVTVWLSGGSVPNNQPQTYTVICTVTTAAGRIYARSASIVIKAVVG